MFFFISKILYFLLCPITWLLILLVAGLIIKNSKVSRRLYIVTVILLILFTNSAIIDVFLRKWEKPFAITNSNKAYEAGIVLGGGMVTIDTDNDRLIFRENTDRFLQALDLYKKGVIKKIIVCGGAGSLVHKETIEAVLIERYLTGIGIPNDDILIDSTSDNTHENAVNCAAIIEKEFKNGRYLLITSALHMKRAQGCFANEGINVTPYPVSKITSKKRTDIGYFIVPETDALLRWDKYLHEVFGYFVYKLMGYI